MTVGSLVAYQIGNSDGDAVVAATTLLTTLSLFHLAAGLLSRNQHDTIFERAAIPGTAQLRRYGFALVAIIAVTLLGPLQHIVRTTTLSLRLWLVSIAIALILVAAEETIKLILRHREHGVASPAGSGLRASAALR
jgi:Ca2+-transporting ATPase